MTIAVAKVYKDRIEMGADGLMAQGIDLLSLMTKKIYKVKELEDLENFEVMYVTAGAVHLKQMFHQLLQQRLVMTGDTIWTYSDYEAWLTSFIYDFNKTYVTDAADARLDIIIANQRFMCCHLVEYRTVVKLEVGDTAAIGCGCDYAKGAFYTGADIPTAVAAACYYSVCCGGEMRTDVLYRK